jgi:hypothetical protein
MPDRYTLHRRIYQWNPDLARRTSIPVPDTPQAIAKHTIRWPESGANPDEMTLNPETKIIPDGAVALIFQKEHVQLNRNGTIASKPVPLKLSSDIELTEAMEGAPRGMTLRQLCARQNEGHFSIVSQVSPNGGYSFEDLSIYDATDPNQWLMVVIVPEEDDYYVYRRLYRTPHGN